MIDCEAYFELLERFGIAYFTGVPDSLLKDFLSYVYDHADPASEITAANEGTAVALAAGHFLATRTPAMVYLQNSGLGNAVNPLTSLADREVYAIPMLLMIGWRGEPGRDDEPQHLKQGRVTPTLLDALEIPYEIHPETLEASQAAIARATDHMSRTEAPYALLVPAKTFAPYKRKRDAETPYAMRREDAIAEAARHLGDDAIVVATTGKTSRELFELRDVTGDGHDRDFLTVGSMGHASQIALAIAAAKPTRPVVVLDGDGAAIMHMGSMAINGSHGPSNFKHVLINNGAHDSVGGQRTVGFEMDFVAIARACGYRSAHRVDHRADLPEAVRRLVDTEGPALLEVRVNPGARSDLTRPTVSAIERKRRFMAELER